MANQIIPKKIRQAFVNTLFDGEERLQQDLQWNYCDLKRKGKGKLRYLFIEGDDNMPSLAIHPVDENGNQFAPVIAATSVYYMEIHKDPFGNFRIPTVGTIAYDCGKIVSKFGWTNLEDCFLTYADNHETQKIRGWLFDLKPAEGEVSRKTPNKGTIMEKRHRGAKVKFPIAVHKLICKYYYKPHAHISDVLLKAGYLNEDGQPIRPAQISQIKNGDREGLFAKFKRNKKARI